MCLLVGESLSRRHRKTKPWQCAKVSPYASAILLAGAEPSHWPIWSRDNPRSLSTTFGSFVTLPGTALCSLGLRFACGPAP